jgi:hypothetical protein
VERTRKVEEVVRAARKTKLEEAVGAVGSALTMCGKFSLSSTLTLRSLTFKNWSTE